MYDSEIPINGKLEEDTFNLNNTESLAIINPGLSKSVVIMTNTGTKKKKTYIRNVMYLNITIQNYK